MKIPQLYWGIIIDLQNLEIYDIIKKRHKKGDEYGVLLESSKSIPKPCLS